MYNDSFKIRYTAAPVAVSETHGISDTLPHMHNEIEILHIEHGQSQIKVAGNTFCVSEGDLVFINPLEVHSITINNVTGYSHRCICFDTSLIADKDVQIEITNGFIKIPCYFEKNSIHAEILKDNFTKLFNAVLKDEPSLLFESAAYISFIFAHLTKNKLLIKNAFPESNKLFYRSITKYLEKHYADSISSKDAAYAIGYTQSYFCRAFRKCFGMNFSEYLNIYRISVSKAMLEYSSTKITDAAYECGFSSPVHFSRCFKKYVGMSPSEYQKCQYKS